MHAFSHELGLKGRSGTVKSGHICQSSDHHIQTGFCDVLDRGSVSFQKGPAFQTSIADALLWPSHAFQSTIRMKSRVGYFTSWAIVGGTGVVHLSLSLSLSLSLAEDREKKIFTTSIQPPMAKEDMSAHVDTQKHFCALTG